MSDSSLQVMIGIYCLCTVWGEPLAQTAQSFMPALIAGAERNLKKVYQFLICLSAGWERHEVFRIQHGDLLSWR